MKEHDILKHFKGIAVVGLSPRSDRPSNMVARYLKEQGYRVIPVNPAAKEILGETCYPCLLDIPGPVEVVNIFRSPEEVPAIVEEAIRVGARVIWMQEGITSEAAASRAREAGLDVVEDQCIKKQHLRMRGVNTDDGPE